MIFKFLLLTDENDTYRREIEINSNATFKELHEAIKACNGFEKNEMASFFMADDEWERGQEISLIEMDTASDKDNYTMDSTHIEDFIEEEGQNLIYVFDYLNDRYFYLTVKEIITGKTLDKAQCVKKVGKAPKQLDESVMTEDLMSGVGGKKKESEDEDIMQGFGDDEGFDNEDLDDLNIEEHED